MAANKTESIHLNDFILHNYMHLFHDNADFRSRNYFLLQSPFPVIIICLVYVIVTCIIGPNCMKGKKPLELRKYIQLYNCCQVLFNVWICTMFIRGGWFTGYNFHCQSIVSSDDPQDNMMVDAAWWFFISKIADFLDTIFFILRKNYRQISILHIWHHAGMPFGCWYAAKFIPGGHVTFGGLLNSFLHVVMYSYYFLSSLGPKVQKYLWWKKYLTIMQMVQFALIVLHQSQLFFIECDFPSYPRYWALLFGPIMFILFMFFYMDSYRSSGDKTVSVKKCKRDGSFQTALTAMTQCYNVRAMEVEDRNNKNFIYNNNKIIIN